MKFRKGDVVAAETPSTYTRVNGGRSTSTRWALYVVAAATRDGQVRKVSRHTDGTCASHADPRATYYATPSGTDRAAVDAFHATDWYAQPQGRDALRAFVAPFAPAP